VGGEEGQSDSDGGEGGDEHVIPPKLAKILFPTGTSAAHREISCAPLNALNLNCWRTEHFQCCSWG
jgi:hypothetical protein